MITVKNLNAEYAKLNQQKLPESLKSKNYKEVKEMLDFYSDDKDIKETVDLFIKKLNQVADKQTKSSTRSRKTTTKKEDCSPCPPAVITAKKTTKQKSTKRKTTAKKTSTKTTQKKPARKKVAQAPDWLKYIRKFKSAANKERTQNYWRTFLNEIQGSFDAKRGKNTPHIQDIRRIQKFLVDNINRNLKNRKFTVKVDEAYIDRLNKITKEVVVSSKLEMPKTERIALSGIRKKKVDTKLGIVNSTDLKGMDFETLNMTGDWKKLIGELSVPFHIMFWGGQGSGKSTLSIKFAHYLASEHNLKILFVDKEEGITKTTKMKYERLKAYHPNIDISNSAITNLKNYDVLFLDSNNELGIEPDDLRAIQEHFPKLSTVSILKATKTGQYLGKSDYGHLVQAEFKCEAGSCSVIKNRFGGSESIGIF